MNKTNIAFKCNFCNGGRTDLNYGFNGVCSEAVIEYNIKKAKYDWCSQPQCYCNKFYNKKISYEELQEIYVREGSVCYESVMLNSWTALAGYDNNGINAGKPRTIKNAEIGSLAILTLVTPNDDEINRRIFAIFLIDEYEEGSTNNYEIQNEGFVACLSKYKLNFTRREANDLMFWDYYSNENTLECRWSSGLFRYFTKQQAAQILKQATLIKAGTKEKELSKEFYEYYLIRHGIDVSNIQSPSGSRIIK